MHRMISIGIGGYVVVVPTYLQAQSRAEIFKESMGAKNRGGIGLSYRPARLHRLAEFIPWNRFLGSINVQKYGLAPDAERISLPTFYFFSCWIRILILNTIRIRILNTIRIQVLQFALLFWKKLRKYSLKWSFPHFYYFFLLRSRALPYLFVSSSK